MAVAKNPKEILWTDTNRYEDGSEFTASDFKAYELGFNNQPVAPAEPVVVMPTAFGVGRAPMPDAVKESRGIGYLYLRVRDNADQVSDWAGPVEVRFTGRPLAPTGFSAQ
jgi:hypothetical protein